MTDAVVLFSGGADSTFALVQTVARYSASSAVGLFVDYGQPAGITERARAEALCASRGVRFLSVSAPASGLSGLSGATGCPVVPGRNALLLAIGVNHAAGMGAVLEVL